MLRYMILQLRGPAAFLQVVMLVFRKLLDWGKGGWSGYSLGDHLLSHSQRPATKSFLSRTLYICATT